jgi:hypothetical protein
VSINANLAGAAGSTVTGGAIAVDGTSDTISVTVNQTAKATAAAGVSGVAPGTVNIKDGNTAVTAADTIATVSLSNYGNSSVESNVLSTLTLKGGSSSLASGTLELKASTSNRIKP